MAIHVESYNTVYGIVFATKSKILRRIIIPNCDDDLWTVHPLVNGETMIFAPAGNNDELPEWENYVFIATGFIPPDPKCAEVLNGRVINFCCADPDLDEAQSEGAVLYHLNGKVVKEGDILDIYK